MRRNMFIAGVILIALVTIGQLVQNRTSGQGVQLPAVDNSADEAAIRGNVAQFAKAFNAGDAKAIAALFTPNGQILDKDGNATEGRDAIAEVFAAAAKANPKRKIEVTVESIRFIGNDLAIEVGTTKTTESANETPDVDKYSAIHVKRDGKWLMAFARDEEGGSASAQEQLQPLAWLRGEWIDDGGNIVVASKCDWSDDKNFLMQTFQIKVGGRDAMTVSQRIGWDPHALRVRSWVFDSEGGFGESIWHRNGKDWTIRATGVRPDGSTASATNHLQPFGPDGFVWRSTERFVAGEHQPDVVVRIVRKPPVPQK